MIKTILLIILIAFIAQCLISGMVISSFFEAMAEVM